MDEFDTVEYFWQDDFVVFNQNEADDYRSDFYDDLYSYEDIGDF